MTRGQRSSLLAAIVATSVVFLDATVVNVALPAIGHDLPSSFLGVLEGQTYVYNAYLLSLSALLILGGALGDFYGRRRIFLIGLAGFGASSALCGLAPNLESLIAFRLLQGATGALLVPGSLAILTAAFRGEERGRVFGTWAGASAALSVIGPFVGGQIVELLSWRFIFLVNVPIVAFAIWAALGIEESRDESASGRFDWLGAAVLALGVGGLTFGAVYGQQRDWQAPLAYVSLAVGAVASLAFPILMARRPAPLVPLGLFRSRNFSVTNVSTLLIYGAIYTIGYYVPIYTQGALGYGAAAAGAAQVPGFLLLVLFSTQIGSLASRHGPRRFMAVGPLLMGAGILWYTRIPADSAPLRLTFGSGIEWLLLAAAGVVALRVALDTRGAVRLGLVVGAVAAFVAGLLEAAGSSGTTGYTRDLLVGQIVYGAGATLMVAPLTTALMSSVPVSRSGLGSAINNAVSRVGPQLGGALLFIAVTAAFYATLGSLVPGLDTASPTVRAAIPPLNHPVGMVTGVTVDAARTASTDAFHLAMLVAAMMAAAGGVVNALGIRDRDAGARRTVTPGTATPGLLVD